MNYVNEEELIKLIEKIDMYACDEKRIFQNIKDLLNSINCDYEGQNSHKFYNRIMDISIKFKTISSINEDFSIILKKNVIKYHETAAKVEKEFKNVI